MENRYFPDEYKLCSAFTAPSIVSGRHYKKLFTAFSVFTHATHLARERITTVRLEIVFLYRGKIYG